MEKHKSLCHYVYNNEGATIAMEVTTMTGEQLEVFAYRVIKERDLAQANLNILEAEIQRRVLQQQDADRRLQDHSNGTVDDANVVPEEA